LLGRLIGVCALLAEKCYVDEEPCLEAYSLATGIPIRDLGRLELELMILLDYRLVVPEKEFTLLRSGDLDALFSEPNAAT
jgi:hypothetical protein